MRVMIGFFAVCDLMAAVGLWLAAPWGGVLWLICATSGACRARAGQTGLDDRRCSASRLDAFLIVAYFALSWLAANERV